VLIPLLLEQRAMLTDQQGQSGQFTTTKAASGSQGYRIQPELGISLGTFNMDMRRLLTLATEEKESIPIDPENRRHLVRYREN
jgi:hypothetical protein